jgi:hypothetical protein
MPHWTSEFTNDPDQDQRLYLELLEDDEYRARVYRDEAGRLMLRVYGGGEARIPLKWLMELAARAEADLPEADLPDL